MSGWSVWFGVGVLAAGAFIAGLVIGGIVFSVLFDDVTPALVIAIVAEGLVAIKTPTRSSGVARAVVVAVIVLLAAGFASDSSWGGTLALVLLALPAIGLADTIASRIDRRPAPRWPS